jgi:hypothetical protein
MHERGDLGYCKKYQFGNDQRPINFCNGPDLFEGAIFRSDDRILFIGAVPVTPFLTPRLVVITFHAHRNQLL